MAAEGAKYASTKVIDNRSQLSAMGETSYHRFEDGGPFPLVL
jgi:hypothetical protein